MNLPDFLVEHPDGEIRLAGHRIGLYHVIDLNQEGHSPEMLHEEYPTLPLALIHKVIAFYLENRHEVDAYVAAYRAELERQEAGQPPSPALLRLRRRSQANDPKQTTVSQPQP
jgi:uncharacterized protein (DUF433 family)